MAGPRRHATRSWRTCTSRQGRRSPAWRRPARVSGADRQPDQDPRAPRRARGSGGPPARRGSGRRNCRRLAAHPVRRSWNRRIHRKRLRRHRPASPRTVRASPGVHGAARATPRRGAATERERKARSQSRALHARGRAMKPPTADGIRYLILERMDEQLAARGLTPSDVPPTFDLLLEGLIDSFGVVEIILMLEQRFAIEFDFAELPADDLTKIGPPAAYVERKSAGS